MTTNDYLKQAFKLDQKINAKLEQLDMLNELATKCTPTYSLAPGSSDRQASKVETIVAKIIDLQNEINDSIDKFVDLKTDIYHAINKVEDDYCQMVLEYRYLCFYKWEEIAVKMNINLRTVFKIHRRALNMVNFIEKN